MQNVVEWAVPQEQADGVDLGADYYSQQRENVVMIEDPEEKKKKYDWKNSWLVLILPKI